MTRRKAVGLFGVAALSGAERAMPTVVELNVGQRARVAVGGDAVDLELLAVRESLQPFFHRDGNEFIEIPARADIDLRIGTGIHTVSGGPFRLPQAAGPVTVLPACTRRWAGGSHPDRSASDVRLEVGPRDPRWYSGRRLAYPIRNYRWRAPNHQHTYLGICVGHGNLYFHRGEDMGMVPDVEQVLSMAAGLVRERPGPEGDGKSNTVTLRDEGGLEFHYAHMNTPHIRRDLTVGKTVAAGDALGLTGNTWSGRPAARPHLHVGVTSGGVYRNTYPMIVEAYRQTYPGSVLPVAGGWQYVWAGQPVNLDAGLSVAPPGSTIVAYEWTLSDGKRMPGRTVTRVYPSPGVYTEQVRVRDSAGAEDLDFVEVNVLSRKVARLPPFAWINYYPVRPVRPGQAIDFRVKYQDLRDPTIDFGDGRVIPWQERTEHTYARAGTYIVTLSGKDDGAGPGTFKSRVVVERI